MIPSEDRKRFGEWLREARFAAGQTQARTGYKVRVWFNHVYYSQTWVSGVERGIATGLTTSQIVALAAAVNADPVEALDVARCIQPRPGTWLHYKKAAGQ